MFGASHPTNDPNLPSFLQWGYLQAQPHLDLVWDVWSELEGCEAEYLPKEPAEPVPAYRNRLARTKFDSRFAPAIKGHAGLLADFTLAEDTPLSLVASQDDIDFQGNSVTTFWKEVDEMVLRDGGCGILVEYPPELVDELGNPLIQSAADQQRFNQRPYLVAIDRRNLLNWSVSTYNGMAIINRVTIREKREVPEGDFGSTYEVLYRELFPGGYRVWELIQSKNAKSGWLKQLREEGTTSLDRVPLIWYSLEESGLFKAKPPFLSLARLNVEHYQKRSSLNEVLHKCNLPIPVRKGLVKSAQDLADRQASGKVPRITIGPNSVIDIPLDGDFFFAEPSGAAIAATQADIAKLEQSMDRVSLAFLTGGETEKTATEAVLDSTQTKASLSGMATRKESALQEVAQLWSAYTGEGQSGGGVVNRDVLKMPIDPQAIAQIVGLHNASLLTRRSTLLELKHGKVLRPDLDVDAELRELGAEETDSTQRFAAVPAPDSLRNDPAEPPAFVSNAEEDS